MVVFGPCNPANPTDCKESLGQGSDSHDQMDQ